MASHTDVSSLHNAPIARARGLDFGVLGCESAPSPRAAAGALLPDAIVRAPCDMDGAASGLHVVAGR